VDDEKVLLAELAALYREIDERYSGYKCQGTTECCRFGITGREPFVTSIELLAIERARAARPLSRKRRPLPLAPREGACPLLTEDARCSIYASRPVGCRSYWCDRAETESAVHHTERNAFVRRVKDLASRHRPDGDRGRPLTRALAK
jgi:Fe-S-cluster containining protein